MKTPSKTLIKGGLFFDGTGAPGVERDVLIVDGVVADTNEPATDVDRVIDAKGKWVMPGFVDMHTHYDAEILTDLHRRLHRSSLATTEHRLASSAAGKM